MRDSGGGLYRGREREPHDRKLYQTPLVSSSSINFNFFFRQIAYLNPNDDSYLLAIPSRDQLRSLLSYMLDEDEFLSPYGIRSMSRYHEKHPYELDLDGKKYKVEYVPGESTSYMFGGNSNWRGPIWFCGKQNQIILPDSCKKGCFNF